jgi:predicted GNAT family N-acyltransferase
MTPARRPPGDGVHGTVFPADVRAGDPVSARVRAAGARADRDAPSQIWRISPLGVELVRPPELGPVDVGTPLDVTLRVGASVATFRGLAVAGTAMERGRELIALRWAANEPAAEGEKREASRWPCGADYTPTGITPNAVRYDDFVHFRVVDISRTGMQLHTSLRNKFLIPGVEFEATCNFPTLGQVRLDFRVVHARVIQEGTRRVLSVGVEYAAADPSAMEIIGQYLLQFGPGASVKDLTAEGFRIRSSSRAFEFGAVATDDDYREVLHLRRLAYVHAKKISDDVKDVEMADAFDARSRILVARYRGRIVGTLRLMFPRSSSDPLKHEDYLALPPTLPPRDQLVEVSKACTHPDFRGSDLFYSLLKHAGLVTIQAGRRYVLMSCTEKLVPIYERFGMRRVDAGYVHPSMRLAHHLMMVDVARAVSGKGVNPLFWNLAGGSELWSFATRCGAIPSSPWLTARVRVWRLFRPLAALVSLAWRRHAARRAAP